MGQYTKKPVTIEAVQITAADFNGVEFDSLPFSDVPEWIRVAIEQDFLVHVAQDTDYAVWDVRTNHGVVRAEPGDWIVRQIDGEIYPCKDALFQATYAPARPGASHEGGGRGLSFGQAIEQAKAGCAIARDGWNGKSMFVVLMPPLYLPPFNTQDTARKVNDRTAKWIGEDQPLDCQPYFAMWTAAKQWQPGWLCSQADMLAEDWSVVRGASAEAA